MNWQDSRSNRCQSSQQMCLNSKTQMQRSHTCSKLYRRLWPGSMKPPLATAPRTTCRKYWHVGSNVHLSSKGSMLSLMNYPKRTRIIKGSLEPLRKPSREKPWRLILEVVKSLSDIYMNLFRHFWQNSHALSTKYIHIFKYFS